MGRNEIAGELRNADLFLFTSISEGMPVSVLEALCCGIPVCSTNCGGVDELINEKNGKVFPIRYHKEMANWIASFDKSKFEPETIRNQVVKKYGRIGFFNRLNEIYLEALNN